MGQNLTALPVWEKQKIQTSSNPMTDKIDIQHHQADDRLVLPNQPKSYPSGMAEESEDADVLQPDSPQEIIADQFVQQYRALKKAMIERIHAQTPQFFENLIIDLLLAMGYGDRRRDLTSHLGRTGDGGVDGAIKQDQLGLDVVLYSGKTLSTRLGRAGFSGA